MLGESLGRSQSLAILLLLAGFFVAGLARPRFHTLLLPAGLLIAVAGLTLVDAFYERVSEEWQAALAFGAGGGIVLAGLGVVARRFLSTLA